jgi:hypothetical protein
MHYDRWLRYGRVEFDVNLTPDPAVARVQVAQGICPYCGLGPFKVVAGHVWRFHQIDRRRFRDDIGVTWGTPTCAPEHSERMRELALEQDSVAAMDGRQIRGRANPQSKVGRENLRAAGRSLATHRRKVPLADHQLIATQVVSGVSAKSIGERYGVSPAAIRRIVAAVKAADA